MYRAPDKPGFFSHFFILRQKFGVLQVRHDNPKENTKPPCCVKNSLSGALCVDYI